MYLRSSRAQAPYRNRVYLTAFLRHMCNPSRLLCVFNTSVCYSSRNTLEAHSQAIMSSYIKHSASQNGNLEFFYFFNSSSHVRGVYPPPAELTQSACASTHCQSIDIISRLSFFQSGLGFLSTTQRVCCSAYGLAKIKKRLRSFIPANHLRRWRRPRPRGEKRTSGHPTMKRGGKSNDDP